MNKALRMSVRWFFECDAWQPTEAQWLLAASCLQSEEKMRIGKFVFKRDAKASLSGRLLMRKCLVEQMGVKYENLCISRDAHGKPFVDGRPDPAFSVSHHGKYAVLAAESATRLGVDVMTTKYTGGKDLDEFFRLMSRHFTDIEWAAIKGAPDRMLMFNRHWALKESYVKATGTGIVVDLRSIEFRVKTESLQTDAYVLNTELFLNGEGQTDWRFQEILLDPEHVVAVAVQNGGAENPPFIKLTFEDLVLGSVPLSPPDTDYCRSFFEKRERP